MFIQNNNASLYTVEFGTGPRTILAHGGWTGSWELWTEPFTYLSKTWRTVSYDHRGTGATIAPVESITLENMTDDLFIVMDRMNLERCVLAAESAGGIVALTAVLQQPHRFDGLVLVDAMTHRENPEIDTDFIHALKANYEDAIGYFVDSCVPESEANSEEIRAWGRNILMRASMASAIKLLEMPHGIDLRPKLKTIQIPTLIFHGDADIIVPIDESEYTASQISNSHLRILKGTGHVPTMTSPRVVADEIDQIYS